MAWVAAPILDKDACSQTSPSWSGTAPQRAGMGRVVSSGARSRAGARRDDLGNVVAMSVLEIGQIIDVLGRAEGPVRLGAVADAVALRSRRPTGCSALARLGLVRSGGTATTRSATARAVGAVTTTGSTCARSRAADAPVSADVAGRRLPCRFEPVVRHRRPRTRCCAVIVGSARQLRTGAAGRLLRRTPTPVPLPRGQLTPAGSAPRYRRSSSRRTSHGGGRARSAIWRQGCRRQAVLTPAGRRSPHGVGRDSRLPDERGGGRRTAAGGSRRLSALVAGELPPVGVGVARRRGLA
jgi:hypothetical protein